jgi:hypothetical protein
VIRFFSFPRLAAIVVACSLSASVANADAVYNVSKLDGSQPGFGFDPDKSAPTVTSQGFYATGPTGDYHSVRFTPGAIGMSGLTLGQITAIAYDHKQAFVGNDWQLKVYTVSSASTGSGWYGYRLNYDLSTATSGGTWSTFTDTNGGAERIKAFNASDIYNSSNPSGFSSLLGTASSQQVMFFDISAGANSGGYPFNTYLNSIKIETNTAAGTSTINAVPVPLPMAAPAGLAIIGLVALKRRARACAC